MAVITASSSSSWSDIASRSSARSARSAVRRNLGVPMPSCLEIPARTSDLDGDFAGTWTDPRKADIGEAFGDEAADSAYSCVDGKLCGSPAATCKGVAK